MHHVVISEPANDDIQEAYDWWGMHRSLVQAERWYREILRTMRGLAHNPESYPLADEKDLRPRGVRQLLFGIGRRPTHRILFEHDQQEVRILRVRHVARHTLTPDDLGG